MELGTALVRLLLFILWREEDILNGEHRNNRGRFIRAAKINACN